MSPKTLQTPSEYDFVEQLTNGLESGKLSKWVGDKEVYLLRNPAKTGVGFVLSGSFYPDFLLWLVAKDGKQWLTFINPKGLRNMTADDPKIQLFSEIKVIEAKIADKYLVLNSFILSKTDLQDWADGRHYDEEVLSSKNILFMNKADYLPKLFERILS